MKTISLEGWRVLCFVLCYWLIKCNKEKRAQEILLGKRKVETPGLSGTAWVIAY